MVDAGVDAGTDAGLDPNLPGVVDRVMSNFVASGGAATTTRCANAVAVVVLPGGDLVRGYGRASDTGSTAPGGDTVFQVGSVTKVFTGVALARLVTLGAVTATAPVRDVIDADLSGGLPASVTFEALVSHTAGLPEYPDNLLRPDAGSSPLSPATGYSRANLLAFLSGWTPGPAGYAYSNLGSGLLGLALDDATDAGSYHAALHPLVLAPLRMNDTWGQVSAMPQAALTRVAQGHFAAMGSWRAGQLATMGVLAGGGEATSTGNDLTHFLRALAGLDATPLDEALALARRPVAPIEATQDIGYGLTIEHRDAGVVYLKAGNTPSYGAFIVVQTAPPVGVAVLAGCGQPYPVGQVALELFEAVGGAPR